MATEAGARGGGIDYTNEETSMLGLARNRLVRRFLAGVAGITALTVSAAHAQPAKPIVLGASISLTGRYAQTGEHFRRGYDLWVRHVNERGGLLGRKVELVVLDDKSDPTTGVRLYEKLITSDQVDLVLGPYSSAVTYAVSNVTEKYKYPMLAAGASAGNIWERGHKYIFMTVAPGEDYLDGAIDIAAKKGAKRIALVNADALYTKEFAKAAVVKIRNRGLSLVYHGEYPEKATDLAAVITQLKSANPEVVLCGSYFQDAVLLVRQMKELGVVVSMIAATVGPSLPEFHASLGPLANHVYGASQWEAISTLKYPGIAKFVDDFQKSYGYQPTYQAAESYGAMEVLEAAVTSVGSVDREKVREALSRLRVETVFGPYQVNAKGVQVAKTALLIQWQNGSRQVVWPDEAAPASPVYPMGR
jgi:branched-chain amino acid transport system substrate-binding protein